MSWDVILLNTPRPIENFEDFDGDAMEAVDFEAAFERYFKKIKKEQDVWEMIGDDFTIIHYPDSEPASNCMLNLYGENAIYAITHLAKLNKWQVFDTSLGELLDLENPSNNGYENFQNYLKLLLGQ